MADQPAHRPYTAEDLGLDDELTSIDVDPQLVQVDRVHYQRPRSEEKVLALMNNPEAREAHPVLIGVRKSGSLLSVDGQHRLEAAMRLGDESVPARAFLSDGWKQERDVYLRLAQFHEAMHTQTTSDGDGDAG